MEHFTKNGTVSQPYKLEILHNLSLVIGSELEHHGQQGSSVTSPTITEDLESDQDEDSFNQGKENLNNYFHLHICQFMCSKIKL